MTQVAIVTGAGSGIGRAASLALSEAGFRLVLAGRHAGSLEETAALLGGEAWVVPTDVTDETSVEALFAATTSECGRVDLLFNNAGVSLPSTPLEELELAEWDRLVATNLTGAFLCLRAAFRAMIAQDPKGGRIINNGSLSAHVPRLYSAAYTATKHAISGLTKSAALDGRRHGIACCQIDIGNAQTEMAAGATHGLLQADGRIAEEPVIDTRRVAAAVSFIARQPLDTNVQFLTIMATNMPFLGRG
jgi:NADP-dependent 3-hydroxy acid dehydrogenase YdfG